MRTNMRSSTDDSFALFLNQLEQASTVRIEMTSSGTFLKLSMAGKVTDRSRSLFTVQGANCVFSIDLSVASCELIELPSHVRYSKFLQASFSDGKRVTFTQLNGDCI